MSKTIKEENFLRSRLFEAEVVLIGGGEVDLAEYQRSDRPLVFARVNNHTARQGGRADMVYTSGTEAPLLDYRGSFIIECRPLPDIPPSTWERPRGFLRYDTNFYSGPNPYGPEHEWLNSLHHELNTIPLTGMIAVAHLLSMPIQSLELIGFDFYKAEGKDTRDSHFLPAQMEWLERQVDRDRRLLLSPDLRNQIKWRWAE